MKKLISQLGPILLLFSQTSRAGTFTVTTTEDAGPGSLRQAILEANATTEADAIVFSIPGPGPFTISPATALPASTSPITIDGTTQPGFTGQPIVELEGSNAGNVSGLRIFGGFSIVRGLAINRFGIKGGQTGFGQIHLGNRGTNRIEGNLLGPDLTGTADLVTGQYGLWLNDSSGNVIGGTNAASRNVISGNFRGLVLSGSSSRNQIIGNFIGVDASGINRLPNRAEGLLIATSDNIIGGATPTARNVISGNAASGVRVTGSGNLLQGNYVGTDVTGAVALGNSVDGFFISGSNNTIGGTNESSRNVISGNARHGLYLDATAYGNFIQANHIGPDVSGRGDMGNIKNGVWINGGQRTTIGGVTPGAGNMIAFNGGSGVFVQAGNGNAIRGNSIFANSALSGTGLGIDLGLEGTADNDSLDRDSGANGLQNFPMLTEAGSANESTVIQGTLQSRPNTVFNLDFYSTREPNPSGYGDGETLLGLATVRTDANGEANFRVTLPIRVVPGQFVTATATDTTNNTSEFSNCVPVTRSAALPVLSIARSTADGTISISWPASADGFVLEEAESLSTPIIWLKVPSDPVAVADRKSVELIPARESRLYRIRKP